MLASLPVNLTIGPVQGSAGIKKEKSASVTILQISDAATLETMDSEIYLSGRECSHTVNTNCQY